MASHSLVPSISGQMVSIRSFWCVRNIPLRVHSTSSVLGCFRSLPIVENAAVNIRVPVPFPSVPNIYILWRRGWSIFTCIIPTTRNVNDSQLCLQKHKKPPIIGIKNKNVSARMRRPGMRVATSSGMTFLRAVAGSRARRWAGRAQENANVEDLEEKGQKACDVGSWVHR